MASREHLLSPQEQTFWQRMAIPLQFFGLGFPEWWGFPKQPQFYIIFYVTTIIFGPVSFVSQILYICIYFKNHTFIELGDIMCIIMVTFMAVTRVVSAMRKIYKKVMIDFVKIVHIYNYEPRNVHVEQILMKVSKYDRYITVIVMTSITTNTMIRIAKPILHNFLTGAFTSNGTIRLETSIYMVMPILDYQYNLHHWYYVQGIVTYIAFIGCSLIGLFDSVMLCIINHLIGRIKILKSNFDDLRYNIKEYSHEEVTKKLGSCIRDHVLIKGCFDDLQNSHGFGVTAYYAFNLIYDAFIIVEFKYGDYFNKMMYFVLFIFFVGGLFGMSLIMENIRIQSDELSNSLYMTKWEDMSVSNRRILLVMFMRVQPTLEFKAFAGLKAGITPALNIMKSTFSYYVMLNTNIAPSVE